MSFGIGLWRLASLLGLVCSIQGLGGVEYEYSSFPVSSPQESAAFCIKYLGAVPIGQQDLTFDPSDYSDFEALSAVRFAYSYNRKFHDLVFVRPSSFPGGGKKDYLDSLESFEKFRVRTHRFEFQETWDWWQDWHLAFLSSESLDPFLHRLLRDEVPFVTRSSSFYVQVPGGIVIQMLGAMTYAWSYPFLFCRQTDEGVVPYQNLSLVDAETLRQPEPPLPEVRPSHYSVPSTKPSDALASLLSFGPVSETLPDFAITHKYSNGTCAQLRWAQFQADQSLVVAAGGMGLMEAEPLVEQRERGWGTVMVGGKVREGYAQPKKKGGYQVHFVDQWKKFEGTGLTVKEVEDFVEHSHGEMKSTNGLFHWRLALSVPSLDHLLAAEKRAETAQVPFFRVEGEGRRRTIFPLPGVLLLELSAQTDESSRGTVTEFEL
uniref:Uncharacterized protein n=1 Tax=Chromera velia CCMP2878 TaxID=1169474 RepID=A0A0G4IF84_9ALVE|eukprot:Cvel_13908.t1-p1 / transcript=Cvel_13908.t1 / gene=Cvel_13908 / organism=Chromera_velia_CCMP2878 / gene_product=hypothetical protein / transcript_product=hypothetical protein / location=Cvel_scaffold969:27870-29451(-) / protein_length=431 / sequence_SO=supercontig / SO=protein_coding / is_pseudo=false